MIRFVSRKNTVPVVEGRWERPSGRVWGGRGGADSGNI